MTSNDSGCWAEVIGDPIAQSKSPAIHNFWLERAGLNARYDAARVAEGELSEYLETRGGDPNWRGCNITMPHKQAALDLVADPGGVRDTIGAINTIARDEAGELFGTNTDAGGFFAPLWDVPIEGQPVTVIGAGGAARAVLFALARAGAGPVTVLNRNVLKASALLMQFGLRGEALPLGTALPPTALLVNASALGMTGHDPLEIDLSPLPDDALVYDLVYSPLDTPLLTAARQRGLETVDGLTMLIAQAALAFEILFGVPVPEGHDDELRTMLVN